MKLHVSCFLILYCTTTFISCAESNRVCEIALVGNSPMIKKRVGSDYVFTVPTQKNFRLNKGELLEFSCSNEIVVSDKTGTENSYQQTIKIKCSGSDLYVINDEEWSYETSVEIECADDDSQGEFYESKGDLPNCPDVTYAIGSKWSSSQQSIYAALCYNLHKSSLKFIQYYLNLSKDSLPSNEDVDEQFGDVRLDDLIEEPEESLKFIQQSDIDDGIQKLGDLGPFLASLFEYNHIIQDVTVQKYLDDLKNFVSTIWWRGLRLGNWKLFVDILSGDTKTNRTHIYSGTSGVITIPKNLNNGKEQKLSFKTSNGLIATAPRYIWLYLANAANSSDDLVVVGCNSPFENYTNPEQPHVFCKDICDEVTWLANTSFVDNRQVNTMGQIFCCRRNEAIKNLDPFPAVEEKNSTESSQESSSTRPEMS